LLHFQRVGGSISQIIVGRPCTIISERRNPRFGGAFCFNTSQILGLRANIGTMGKTGPMDPTCA